MAEKTTVTVTAHDGTVKTFSGDTAIVFTIEKAQAFLDGEAEQIDATSSYTGQGIPEEIFAETISSLVGKFVEKTHEEQPLLAAFNLRSISEMLEAHSERIFNSVSLEEKKAMLDKAFEAMKDLS